MKKVTIIGGGLSGLITSIQLVRAQIPVQLFEKKRYPFHRVCGEYISNETLPFLKKTNLFPEEFYPTSISQFQLTSINGKSAELSLDLGGFGISRYTFDHWLLEKAVAEGVEVHQAAEVNKVEFSNDQFSVSTLQNSYSTDVVVGAFGKRSKVDKALERSFIKKSSPYIGVKYHIRTDHRKDLIALHNFENGYCGISNVENDISNLCYLSHRNNLKTWKTIQAMEENVLFKNPFLKQIFNNSEFLFDQPETINEISFETKGPIENHILMSGDAAGMITPLCGNGMAMAIHSSKILSDLLIPYCQSSHISRDELEKKYTHAWNNEFATRLWVGRQFQNLFGAPLASNLAVGIMGRVRPLARYLVSKSHGSPF